MRKFWEKPICGIYKITHRESGKCYIGQSVDVFARWKNHSSYSKKKMSKLQKGFKLYGIKQFSFEVIEECDKEMLNDREVYWIAYFNSYGKTGYNSTRGGSGSKTSKPKESKPKESKPKESKPKESKPKRIKTEEDKIFEWNNRERPEVPWSRPRIECPHCSKTGLASSKFKRWHFENCKIYKELGVPKLDN